MRQLLILARVLALVSALVGCSKQPPHSDTIPVIATDAEHNRYYKEASNLVMPYLKLVNASEKPANTPGAQGELRRGIALYEAVIKYAPRNWSAYWLMGKAHQALGEHEAACDALGNAFAIERRNVDVAREYMLECLDLGRHAEAVSAGEHAVSVKPRDAGLLANLALAYLMAGRNTEALSKVEESLSIDPSDKITASLKRVIREIIDGKRPQPKTVNELESK